MRIIGGNLCGLKLVDVGVGDVQVYLCFMIDWVWELMFNLLVNGMYGNFILGVCVLDLFVGIGVLGFEVLLCGVVCVVFVDDGVVVWVLLCVNIEKVCVMGVIDVWWCDVINLGENCVKGYDLVFLDLFYGKGMGEVVLVNVLKGGWIVLQGMVVWEEFIVFLVVVGLIQIDQCKYGDMVVMLLCFVQVVWFSLVDRWIRFLLLCMLVNLLIWFSILFSWLVDLVVSCSRMLICLLVVWMCLILGRLCRCVRILV